jgi:hypothetical protein
MEQGSVTELDGKNAAEPQKTLKEGSEIWNHLELRK